MHPLPERQEDLPDSITKEEIQNLPLYKYQGVTHIVQDIKGLKEALNHLKVSPILGFDTESRPAFEKGKCYPPSLIQLATDKAVFLFHLNEIKNLKLLFEVLSNPSILKVGVAINDDIRKLKEIHLFEDQGFIEISNLSKKMGIKNTGLRNLAGIFLKIKISKKAQTSNWARYPLTFTQVSYAATDAWISREIYIRIKSFLASQA